jgi:hypothetical protein
MLTMHEQILRERGERALERLAIAKAQNDPVELAAAKLAVTRVQGSLQQTSAATGKGAMAQMRQALSRAMTV